jgi:isopenicillin-N epimerase
MVPLNLEAIGAAYYTGNCHKWLCAPKGAAFLYVRPDRQDIIRPLTVSHGANSPRTDRSRFLLEFDWMGTDDPTAFLSVPVALDVIGSLLPGGWPEVMARNRQLAIAARQRLCEAIAVELPAPASMLGSLAAIPLPQGFPADLQPQLYQRLGIQVPVFDWNGQRILRISAQLYNSLDRYDKLAHALQQLRQENVEQID